MVVFIIRFMPEIQRYARNQNKMCQLESTEECCQMDRNGRATKFSGSPPKKAQLISSFHISLII